MANTTESKETVSRTEFATYLRNLADQFESGGDAQIQVGNKSVTVHPSENVECEVTVTERSAILRGDKEALDLEAKWKKGDGESRGRERPEDEDEDENENESEAEARSGNGGD